MIYKLFSSLGQKIKIPHKIKNTILVRTFGHFGTFHYPIGHTYSNINMQVFTELYLDFF